MLITNIDIFSPSFP
uniref:Uncharacterized protein n=1 Tax=Arundo donax TaxID=35708 RepID=A0A0A9EK90_ARUDO